MGFGTKLELVPLNVLHRCLTKGMPPGHIANMGMLPEHTTGLHASRHSPSQGSTHGVPKRRLANTGTGTTVHCKCASESLQDMSISTLLAPSTRSGDISSIRPIHSAGRGTIAHPWGRHSPMADGSKAPAAISPGSWGQCVPLQPMWTSHPPSPTTEVTLL